MNRPTTVPCREVGVWMLVVAPIVVVEICPKPAVGTSVWGFLSWVAAALAITGLGASARLKTFANSMRRFPMGRRSSARR